VEDATWERRLVTLLEDEPVIDPNDAKLQHNWTSTLGGGFTDVLAAQAACNKHAGLLLGLFGSRELPLLLVHGHHAGVLRRCRCAHHKGRQPVLHAIDLACVCRLQELQRVHAPSLHVVQAQRAQVLARCPAGTQQTGQVGSALPRWHGCWLHYSRRKFPPCNDHLAHLTLMIARAKIGSRQNSDFSSSALAALIFLLPTRFLQVQNDFHRRNWLNSLSLTTWVYSR
jgi:hypothetical protein